MTILVDKYKNHSIHQSVEDALQYISDYKAQDNLTDEQQDSLNAYEQLIVYIKVILQSNISQIVPTQILDNLNSQISLLKSAKVLNIEGTYNIYSAIMDAVSKIPFREQKGIIKASLDKIIDNFSESRDIIKTNIENEISKFNDRQDSEINSWEKKKEELETEINQLKLQKEILEQSISSLETKVTDESDRLDSIIANFKKSYETQETGFKTNFDDKSAEYEERITAIEESSNNQIKVLLDNMKEKEAEVEKLWGIIGKASVSGNSQSYANKAKNFADLMMWISLFIMSTVIFFLACAFYKDITSTNFNPMSLLYRIPLSFTFLLPAWYCANIANKQRNREFQLRDFEVKTAALEPFIEQMKFESENAKENEKDKTKLDLVKDIFSNDLKNKKLDDNNVVISKDIAEIIKAIPEIISKSKGGN